MLWVFISFRKIEDGEETEDCPDCEAETSADLGVVLVMGEIADAAKSLNGPVGADQGGELSGGNLVELEAGDGVGGHHGRHCR